jgi:hypothetical protein
VIASEAWLAEVLAKAAFLAGAAGGVSLFASTGTDGLLIDDEGHVHAKRRTPPVHRRRRHGHGRRPAMRTQVTWYVARSAGIVAWSLAAGAVIWGLALLSRALGTKPRPAWLYDLHRFLGGAALIFTGIHVAAILADQYVHFSVVNVQVPLTGTWHPLAVAWGIVAFYLLLAVELTSLLRARVPKRLWRRVHFAGFAVFGAGTIHGLTADTDAGSPAFRLAMIGACAMVAVLTAIRVAHATRPQRRPRPAARNGLALPATPQVLHRAP